MLQAWLKDLALNINFHPCSVSWYTFVMIQIYLIEYIVQVILLNIFANKFERLAEGRSNKSNEYAFNS